MQLLDSLVEAVDESCVNLAEGNLDAWGFALDRTWQIKKQLSNGISNPIIDEMYRTARSAGALGGKILGAGGGGFLLLYVPKSRQINVIKALDNYRHIPFSFENQGSQIIFAN